MQDSDLRDAVKALLLKYVDDQCKKSEESSSVLRLCCSQGNALI